MDAQDREYRWDDEARVLVWPEQKGPNYHADLAACVTRALEIAGHEPKPAKILIEHASGMIELDEIERLAADPSFPSDPDAARLRTTSKLP